MEIRGLNVASLEYAGGDQGKDLLHYLPDTGDNLPSTLLERSELERLLAASIDDIPEIERTVLSLYYHEELTLREIAQVVNLHESRISQLKSQAILRLRGQMADTVAAYPRHGEGMSGGQDMKEPVRAPAGSVDGGTNPGAGGNGRPEAGGEVAGRYHPGRGSGSLMVGTTIPKLPRRHGLDRGAQTHLGACRYRHVAGCGPGNGRNQRSAQHLDRDPGQALGGMARSIGTLMGREVTCTAGSEHAPENPPENGAAISIKFKEAALPPLWLGFSPALVSMVCNPPAPAVPEVDDVGPDKRQEGEAPQRRSSTPPTMDLILDVELPVSISFGKTEMPMKDVLKLTTGSIVELNRGVNEPVEVMINHCLIARGEVVGGRRELWSPDPAHCQPAGSDAEYTMNFVVGALAILSAVVLTAAAVSLFALHRAHVLLGELKRRSSSRPLRLPRIRSRSCAMPSKRWPRSCAKCTKSPPRLRSTPRCPAPASTSANARRPCGCTAAATLPSRSRPPFRCRGRR